MSQELLEVKMSRQRLCVLLRQHLFTLGLRTALAQTMSEASVPLVPAVAAFTYRPIGIGLNEMSWLFVAQPDDQVGEI